VKLPLNLRSIRSCVGSCSGLTDKPTTHRAVEATGRVIPAVIALSGLIGCAAVHAAHEEHRVVPTSQEEVVKIAKSEVWWALVDPRSPASNPNVNAVRFRAIRVPDRGIVCGEYSAGVPAPAAYQPWQRFVTNLAVTSPLYGDVSVQRDPDFAAAWDRLCSDAHLGQQGG